jgi:hypothetical protein
MLLFRENSQDHSEIWDIPSIGTPVPAVSGVIHMALLEAHS